MKYWLAAASFACSLVHANPAIDMKGHLEVSREAAAHRQSRRVTEEEFIRMSREPGTVILDARSRDKFDELHVRGAINLPFPDIALFSYGYRNVYELGALIDIRNSALPFAGSPREAAK